ncbi:F-box/LRR-repeat protein 25 [Ziziphus jujuba]|uniref:F-box/LRR-repeat protein 25 n=1 Tax=Ziziphus jujuba TaxID=326968 RepID=A0A6P3ZC97_ZIZJJ|nr:F-box/LRR-repeat protein 25 [Ziziphus jujuba]
MTQKRKNVTAMAEGDGEHTLKKKMKLHDEETNDRISDLPEPIIHHIMSFLPSTLDATHMSSLSKKFFSTWRSFPELVFDFGSFANLRRVKKTSNIKIHMFLNWVYDSIQSRLLNDTTTPCCFERLTFWGPLDGFKSEDYRVEKLLDFAVEKKVKDLDLSGELKYYDYVRESKPYSFPVDHAIFSASSVRNLKLQGFRLKQKDLTFNFPSVESFSLKNCCGFKSIKLSGTKLREVKLESCEGLRKIDIDATETLESFCFGGVKEKCVIGLSSAKFHKSLELRTENFVDEFWVGNEKSNLYGDRWFDNWKIITKCKYLAQKVPIYLF